MDEALRIIGDYDFPSPQGHLLFADRMGKSFIWEAGDVTIPGSDHFQIITNFLLSRRAGEAKRDPRYRTVDGFLRKDPPLSHELVRRILSETQQDITQYSVVFDLTRLTVDVYHQRNFSRPIQLDVKEQLHKKAWSFPIAALFN